MTCESFIDNLDKMIDSRSLIDRSALPSEMISHLDRCPDCSGYFEEMTMIQMRLTDLRRENIPFELYWKLMRSAREWEMKRSGHFMKGVTLNVSRTLFPVLALWIASFFFPPPVQLAIDILIYIAGLVLVFEKLGRRLITNRV